MHTTLSKLSTFPILVTSMINSPLSLADSSFSDPLLKFDNQRWWVADGWSNGFPFYNRWENESVVMNNSGMAITLDYSPIPLVQSASTYTSADFRSGELRSHDFYGYGCYEVEIKPVKASGVISAFFLFTGPSDKPRNGNGLHNEIDIEFLGNNTRVVQLNFWTNDDSYERSHEYLLLLDFDAAEAFHHYAIEWAETGIKWYIDSKEVYSVISTPDDPTPSIRDNRLRIMANVWAAHNELSNWTGFFDRHESAYHTTLYRNIQYKTSSCFNL